MKLHIVSDLHNEFSNYQLPLVEADVLVLAGDIGVGLDGLKYAVKNKPNYKHVIYVLGNHEFYGHNISLLSKEIKEEAQRNNIIILDDDCVILDDVKFIGSTFWSDFRLYGDDLGKIGYFMHHAKNALNDFSQIRYAGMYFTPSHCAQLNIISQEFIDNELNIDDNFKKVVITHHAPSLKSISEKYLGNNLNPCFASDAEKLVRKADVWIHGHTHDSFDYKIENCRVIANPRGYSKYQEKQENINFNGSLVINLN